MNQPSNLKFAGRFKAGDIIRSYDFQPMAGRGDSYLEGTVVDADFMHPQGFACYKVSLSGRVFGGKRESVEANEIGYFPHQTSVFEYDHRIIKV